MQATDIDIVDWEREYFDEEYAWLKDEVIELPDGEERLMLFKRMLEEHGLRVFKYDNEDGCLMLDVTTASMLVQIAEKLNPEHRAKYLQMDLGRMVDLSWKLVS